MNAAIILNTPEYSSQFGNSSLAQNGLGYKNQIESRFEHYHAALVQTGIATPAQIEGADFGQFMAWLDELRQRNLAQNAATARSRG